MAITHGANRLDVALLINPSTVKRRSTAERPNWLDPESAPAIVHKTLVGCGFNVAVIAACDCASTIRRIELCSPDVIFNLTCHSLGDPRRASQLAAVLNILNIPFTGSGPQGIFRACDNSLSKTLVSMIGGRVPKFTVVQRGNRPDFTQLRFPVLVRSRYETGFEDQAHRSVARDIEALRALIRTRLRRRGEALVCEELVAGREISVGIVGNERMHVFPMAERTRGGRAGGAPQSRRRAKNSSRPTSEVCWRQSNPPPHALKRLREDAKRICLELQLRDLARIDFCLTPSGEHYFLNASSCPDCTPASFGMFAAWQSIGFAELLASIMVCAITRHQRETGMLRRSTVAKLPPLIAGLHDIRALMS